MASTCLYKEVHPPTGVTHAASGFVTHTADDEAHPNLILARGTELQVYVVRKAPGTGTGEVSSAKALVRLEQVCRYPLNGVVESMALLKSRSHGQRDAVLLTFRDAKLVVLEWCCALWTMRVSSMHSLEGEPALKQGKEVFPIGPRVLTDPQGRGAAVLLYDNQLAVLPAIEADHFAQMADSRGNPPAHPRPAAAAAASHHPPAASWP